MGVLMSQRRVFVEVLNTPELTRDDLRGLQEKIRQAVCETPFGLASTKVVCFFHEKERSCIDEGIVVKIIAAMRDSYSTESFLRECEPLIGRVVSETFRGQRVTCFAIPAKSAHKYIVQKE